MLLGVDGRTPGDVESLLDDIAGAREAIRLRLMRGGKISVVDVDLKGPGAPRDTDASVRRGPDAGDPGGAALDARERRGTDARRGGLLSHGSSELSEADVVLLANEELLEEASFAVAEDGTQALVLISEDDHAVSRLRAMQLRGWGVVPPRRPARGARGRGRRGGAGPDRAPQSRDRKVTP